jgi:SsrA-binding protein
MPESKKTSPKIESVHANRKALFDFEVLETFEAGIKLLGWEVKSLREGGCNLKGSYVVLAGGRPVITGMRISPYSHATTTRGLVDPVRERDVLLKKRDIERLAGKVKEKGISLIATEVYFKGNLAKLKLALGRGRKAHDKRQLLKERDIERDAVRSVSERG